MMVMRIFALLLLVLGPVASRAQVAGNVGMVNLQSGLTYTLQNPDCDPEGRRVVVLSNTSNVTVTLPQAGSSGAFSHGCVINIINPTATATDTINVTTSTINGANSLQIFPGAWVRIYTDAQGNTGNYWAQITSAPTLGYANVKDFGAKCDYQTDDTVAINHALAATDPVRGGDVWFPQGGCYITGSLVVNHPNVHLQGAGEYASTIITNTQPFDVITLNASYFQMTDLGVIQYASPGSMRSWVMYDNTSAGSGGDLFENINVGGGDSGFYLKGGINTFRNINMRGIGPGSGIGMEFDGPNVAVIDLYNIYMENAANENAQAGIFITGGVDFVFDHLQLQKMGSPLIVQAAPGFGAISGAFISNSYFDTSVGPEVLLDGTNGSVNRISFVNSWFSSSGTSAGLKMIGSVDDISVSDSQIFFNAGCGIDATQTTYNQGLLITGNTIANNASFGVCLGNQSKVRVLNNSIALGGTVGPNGGGISIPESSTADYISIIGNDLSGNNGVALQNGSNGWHNVIKNNTDGYVMSAANLSSCGTNPTFGTISSTYSGTVTPGSDATECVITLEPGMFGQTPNVSVSTYGDNIISVGGVNTELTGSGASATFVTSITIGWTGSPSTFSYLVSN